MDLREAVAATGLLAPGRPVVVLLSGGRDSVCLLDVAVRISGAVRALHADYGLRPESAAEAALCARLCAAIRVPLTVVRPPRPSRGNRQAWARDARYAAARALAAGGDVAAGHTATDQVETVLYRLAASPGRRALLGMRERDGDLVRPLLHVTREQTAAHCAARGLPFADDPGNDGDAYARSRVRGRLVPALRGVHPAAEANVLATLELLRDEAAVLDAAVAGLLDGDAIALDALAAAPPALARLGLQSLADRAAGGRAPAVGRRLADVLALGGAGSRALDLGRGLRAEVVYGVLRVRAAGDGEPVPVAPVMLPVPGAAAFAGGAVTAEPAADGPLDAARLGAAVVVRARRPGDRVRPAGGRGTRSLQDLLTDRKVPRADRGRLPVVEAGGEVACVPGVVTGAAFAAGPATQDRVRVTWAPPGRIYPPG